jgi:hypothetical protein
LSSTVTELVRHLFRTAAGSEICPPAVIFRRFM